MPTPPTAEDPKPTTTTPLSEAELRAMWKLHRLQAPTFDDLTAGLCLGLVWCMALWAPMFIAVLL